MTHHVSTTCAFPNTHLSLVVAGGRRGCNRSKWTQTLGNSMELSSSSRIVLNRNTCAARTRCIMRARPLRRRLPVARWNSTVWDWDWDSCRAMQCKHCKSPRRACAPKKSSVEDPAGCFASSSAVDPAAPVIPPSNLKEIRSRHASCSRR
jgi:hypothetical protein